MNHLVFNGIQIEAAIEQDWFNTQRQMIWVNSYHIFLFQVEGDVFTLKL